MSSLTTRQSLNKAIADYQYCQQRLPTCYTFHQRQSLLMRMQKLQYRINCLSIKLQNELVVEQRRGMYKGQLARQRAFNATYHTMKPRRGNGRRYY